jgi:hypothetical protein
MAKCVDCGTLATIYDDGVPLCLLCCDIRDAAVQKDKREVSEPVVKQATHGK